MKSLLICPDEVLAVRALSRNVPPAAIEILGKPLVAYWIEHLVSLGATDVKIIASDRPQKIREIVHDGYPWGIRIEVIVQRTQPTAAEAREVCHAESDSGEWLPAPYDVIEMISLPNIPVTNLFESFESYFNGVRGSIPRGKTNRVNMRQVSPGAWVSVRSKISDQAVIKAPCWIGDNVQIADGVVIGPMAVLENNSVIGKDALVTNSIVQSHTYIGELTTVEDSIACRNILINWKTNSVVEIPDSFLISAIGRSRDESHRIPLFSRATALFIGLITTPFVVPFVLHSVICGKNVCNKLIAVSSSDTESTPYFQLSNAAGYFGRWPQLWNIVRGEFSWFGNRPLSPREASDLNPDFERLWLERPPGLFSQADAAGCWDNLSEEAIGHSCYYAAQRGWRSHLWILRRVLSNWRQAAQMENAQRNADDLKQKAFSLRKLVTDFLSL